ncbi:MAG: hypothetical protein ILO43_04025 [Clostridia bacterium]|nr:hypothetical protein [Clostridia bacterium]MBP5459193.1 hypothetical protein [Clostridia bacterium]
MFTLVLKTTLEVAAIVLLLIGYLNEEKVIAFERKLWARLRDTRRASAPSHSATYLAAREEARKNEQERARIARNAEYARKQAVLLRTADDPEPKRVA